MVKKVSVPQVNVKLLYTIAFSEGAAVMAVELLGAKMIAPFYGNSLYVWASILGLTLIGLAGGYFTGGQLTKKFSNNKLLFSILIISAVLILIMPQWGSFIMERNLSLSFLTGTIISGIFFILPPLFCLGMVSPVIINVISEQDQSPGKVSGIVYGVSTIGGVFMTFFIAFYLIPEWGLKASAYFTGIFLAVFPILYFIKNKKLTPVAILFFIIIIIAAKSQKLEEVSSSEKVLYLSDGILGQVLVTDEYGSGKRTLYVNNIPQTLMHVPTGRSLWRYIHRIAMYSSVKPEGADVLICGLGGGVLGQELQNLGFNVEFVELDERIEYTAKKFFNLNSKAKVHIDDARHFINSCSKSYDIIIMDTSTGETQPSNVYTVECFKKINKLLKNNGMMFVHYQNVIEGEGSIATRSIGKTIIAANFECKLLNTRENLSEINEVMFFCSKKDIKLEEFTFERRDTFADPYKFPIKQNLFVKNYSFNKGMVLTDDTPKMEFLHQNTIRLSRENAINKTLSNI